MSFRFRCLLPFGLMLLLAACAPVILGRTPEPAPVGQTEITVSAGYPVLRTMTDICTQLPEPQPDPSQPPLYAGCFGMGAGPDYWPLPQTINIMSAWGTQPGQELNTTYMLSLGPGFRFGGKSLLQAGTPKLAADYGASIAVSGIILDAGLLASVPLLPGYELYGGLRGYGLYYWTFAGIPKPALLASTTLGLTGESEAGTVFLELTLAVTQYNEYAQDGPTAGVAPFGITLMPAIGFTF